MPPGETAEPIDLSAAPGAARDDWPFLYLREPTFPVHYIVALVLLWAVLLVARAAQRSGTSLRR